MIDRRSHTITFKNSETAKFDPQGNPIAASDVWAEPMACRCETDAESTILHLKEGWMKRPAYVVYLDHTGTNYDGRIARLYDQQGTLVCEGVINHTTIYQLSTVLYL